MAPFDANTSPPLFVAPIARRPSIIVDQYRIMLADPQGNLIGQDGDMGAAGRLGHLTYAQRTPGNRSY